MEFIQSNLTKLSRNEVVEGKVHSVTSTGALICSFGGQLIRVENQSQKKINVGDSLKLQVTQLRPLALRFLGQGAHSGGRGFSRLT